VRCEQHKLSDDLLPRPLRRSSATSESTASCSLIYHLSEHSNATASTAAVKEEEAEEDEEVRWGRGESVAEMVARLVWQQGGVPSVWSARQPPHTPSDAAALSLLRSARNTDGGEGVDVNGRRDVDSGSPSPRTHAPWAAAMSQGAAGRACNTSHACNTALLARQAKETKEMKEGGQGGMEEEEAGVYGRVEVGQVSSRLAHVWCAVCHDCSHRIALALSRSPHVLFVEVSCVSTPSPTPRTGNPKASTLTPKPQALTPKPEPRA
jgi:hypothetical protein